MWKNAAAASFVHSVAVTKSRHSAQKINAVLTERLVAHKLVNAVLKFWQIVTESFLRGENDGSSISLHSNGPAPMEVDVLELKKVCILINVQALRLKKDLCNAFLVVLTPRSQLQLCHRSCAEGPWMRRG